jgi:GNAT superfamily N-acetyltransferase
VNSEIIVAVRALEERDWESLRALRLKALRTEPGVFCALHADEAGKPESEWRTLTSNVLGGQRVFGLFDGDALVGLSGVFTDRADASGETALFAMSYIEPAYRGRGFARLFFEARLDWVRSRGAFKRVRVSHRRSNDISRRANQRYGFVETHAVERTWPDETQDDEVVYELDLR